MTKKIYYSWANVKNFVIDISLQLYKDQWRPDYIVGITRGGNIPAVMLSHMIDVPCESLKVSLRDNASSETNCWMSEDAYGFENDPKKILIVDDINDTGATIDWIKKDWRASCLPNDEKWESIWGDSVRFATLVDNLSSKQKVNYRSVEINKASDPCWIVFPWEDLLTHTS